MTKGSARRAGPILPVFFGICGAVLGPSLVFEGSIDLVADGLDTLGQELLGAFMIFTLGGVVLGLVANWLWRRLSEGRGR